MSNKKANKITYAGETLIDLTTDTVTPETLKSGYTAHSASGEKIVGTYEEKDFVGATASVDGQHGLVPAPPKAAVNGDYVLLPTGDWGRLKALGYYTATANTNPDSPANKIVSVLVKSGIAASLSSKLPSTNGQNYISIPSDNGNEYAQVSFDTTDNAIYFRTRKKVNDVDTWTTWQQLRTKNVVTTATLTAGDTCLVIIDTNIKADSLFDIYTDKYGVNPTNVTSRSGSMALFFEAQTSDINVKVVIS